MNLHGSIESRAKPKVLIFVSQFGAKAQSSGPAKSIANVVEAMQGWAQVAVVARGDIDGRPDGVPLDQWHHDGTANIFYASRGRQTPWHAYRLIREAAPDTVYLNGIFNYRSSIAPLIAMWGMVRSRPKIILAPRGELAPDAMQHNARKKRRFIAFAKLIGLHRHLAFQAGGVADEADIARVYARHPIVTALDIGEMPGRTAVVQDRGDDRFRLLFLSRITPIKNLDFAIEAVRHCREPVHFTIAGPETDQGYARKCRALADALPSHVTWDFKGQIPQDHVSDTMAAHDLFILPTGGENFCHAVHESLAVGTPVLISDRTNWTDRLDGKSSWALPLEGGTAPFTAVIDQLASEEPIARLRRIKQLMDQNPAKVARDEAILATRRMLAPQRAADQSLAASSPLS